MTCEVADGVAAVQVAGVQVACAQPCVLGEGPVWDHRIDRLHWVDIHAPAILTLDPTTGFTVRRPMPQTVGFVALTEDPAVVVAGLRDGLYRVMLETGAATRLTLVEGNKPNNRINDGTVAPDGAIVFGTLDIDHAQPTGAYWRYHQGTLTALGGAMTVTNGPGLSADGRRALTVDSIGRKVFSQSFADGQFGTPTPFAEVAPGQGVPDGVTFDAEGHVWLAHYGGSQITRFRPDGSIERVVTVPAHLVTKCAFGGPEMTALYITTGAHRRSLGDEPLAGCLFKLQTDIVGVRANIAIV
jgi:sugar lactone lactonase YvrE